MEKAAAESESLAGERGTTLAGGAAPGGAAAAVAATLTRVVSAAVPELVRAAKVRRPLINTYVLVEIAPICRTRGPSRALQMTTF